MTHELEDTLAAGAASTGATFDATPPRIAERYEILGLLGTGGMGAVYRVRDVTLGELVALKVLRPELMHDQGSLVRFREEVRLARRVTHRNVARTFDIGEQGGVAFLTMELVDGRSLASILGERGALPGPEVVEIALAICAGLSAAHAAAVVHRDLKPENVLIAKDGRVVVTDFGIARAHDASVKASAIMGTPTYMAPEQFEPGATIDARTDIYALGAVIYEMLTGERAWPGASVMEVLATRAREREPRDPRALRPHASEALSNVAMRCLRAVPAERFSNAGEVARALGAFELGPAIVSTPRRAPLPQTSNKTVAVLPFENAGGKDDDFLAAGLMDDLIDTLSMTRGLLVRPRGVVMRFAGSSLGPQDLGRELGVQVIVEGSLRRSGDKVRLGVRLIGTADGFQLWAQRFEAPVGDLLVVSDRAARAIADALTTELSGAERSVPTDPAAVELYLRARAKFLMSWRDTAAPAAKLFESALALAPSDPRIVAGCAQALVRMIFFGEGERSATIARARDLTERAVKLGPELGDAWSALANFRLHTGDAEGAMRAARAGLDHVPSSAGLQDMLGRLLLEAGHVDEAIVRLEIALRLDPSLFTPLIELARAQALLGDFARADATLARLDEHSTIGNALRGRFVLWSGIDRPDLPLEPGTHAEVYVSVLRHRSLTPQQRAFLELRAAKSVGRLRVLFYQRNAEILAFLGDVDAATGELDRSLDAGLLDLLWMDRCPVLGALRDHPRWSAQRAIVEERAKKLIAAMSGAGD